MADDLTVRSLMVVIIAALPVVASAQLPSPATAASATGTYETRSRPAAGEAGRMSEPGCALEIAPVPPDSVRVQLECSRGAPSYHLGFLDERLAFRAGKVVYETSGHSGPCRILIRLSGPEATVRQEGSDLACGFGFGVYTDGRYRRISRKRPPFDLNPVGRGIGETLLIMHSGT